MTNISYQFEADRSTVMECKDCGFKTLNAAEFSDHCRECKINPVALPKAEAERIEGEKQLLTRKGM